MSDESDFLNDLLRDFAAYISLEALREVMIEANYEAIRAALGGATREEIIRAASERAAELVTNIGEQMRERLREAIVEGVTEQLGPDGTARLLRDGLGLDKVRAAQLEAFRESGATEEQVARYRQELINERARVIAQTEMGNAIEAGNLENAKTRGATHKIWIVTQGNVCPICASNQAQGPIPIGESFGSGHDAPTAHVRCLCSCSYLTDTGKGEIDRARDRAARRDEELKQRQAVVAGEEGT